MLASISRFLPPRRYLVYGVLAALLFMVGRHSVSRETGPLAPRVVAATKYVRLGRPIEQLRLIEKVRWRAQAPRQEAITPAPTLEGRQAVGLYCRTATPLPIGTPDTARVTPAASLPDFRGKVAGGKVRLWSVLSDGAEWTGVFDVPTPHWDFLTRGGSVIVHTERSPWIFGRALARCATGAGLAGTASLASGGSQGAVLLSSLAACGLRLAGAP